MSRCLAILLSLALVAAPILARAEEPQQPPGRATELAEGQAAPYAGSLVDRERMGAILAKRIAAELERDAMRLDLQQAQHDRDVAAQKAAEAESARGPSWGVLIGVTATALVIGIAGGVAATLAIQDRVK